MSKKILTIILITLIVATLLVLGFLFLRRGGENGGVSITNFFPFGQAPESGNVAPPAGTTGQNQNGDQVALPGTLPTLRKISENPIAGFGIFSRQNETIIRFVDKATGHIFEASSEFSGLQRLTNTTLPKIQEAVFAGENNVIVRFLKEDEETIESVSVRLIGPGGASESTVAGFEFTSDLKQGSSGIAVLNLQKALNMDSETRVAENGPGSPGRETSFFGPATIEAVKKFQQKYAEVILLPEETPEGVVNQKTRDKLNEITGAKMERQVDPEAESFYETILTFLPTDIKEIIYLESLGKIFYTLEDNLGTVGFLSSPDGLNRTQIFESPATEWEISSIDGENILLFSKPTSNFPGVAYILKQNGAQEKILGSINGLTVSVNNSREKAMFSQSSGNSFSLNALDLVNKNLLNLPVLTISPTLPEKCAWSKFETDKIFCFIPEVIPSGNYPDAWYQGLVTFNDSLVDIDLETSISSPVLNLESVDSVNPKLSESEQYLFFTNKKDSSLWSYRLFSVEDFIETESENVENN